MLANLANLPEVIRAELPGRYGEVPRSPTEGIGLPDDDVADRATWDPKPAAVRSATVIRGQGAVERLAGD